MLQIIYHFILFSISLDAVVWQCILLFYSILFYSILFCFFFLLYFVLFYSILFFSFLVSNFHSPLFPNMFLLTILRTCYSLFVSFTNRCQINSAWVKLRCKVIYLGFIYFISVLFILFRFYLYKELYFYTMPF